jgi:hypothetical protein
MRSPYGQNGFPVKHIVVLLDKSISVRRHADEKFMLVWKNNMLFSGKITILRQTLSNRMLFSGKMAITIFMVILLEKSIYLIIFIGKVYVSWKTGSMLFSGKMTTQHQTPSNKTPLASVMITCTTNPDWQATARVITRRLHSIKCQPSSPSLLFA